MNEPYGPCDWCEQPAIVKVNDHLGCAEHVDVAMSEAFNALRSVIKDWGK